jgi:Tol biopolymer transport system component
MSHDGRHLAYTQLLFDVNIWSVAGDGSGSAKPLIDSPFPDSSPRFSPDGRRIAFHSVRSGTHEIWVCDANGANAVQLTDGRGFNVGNPRWSPDGSRIAFEWWPTGNRAIYVAPSGGGKSRRLVPDGFQDGVPAWSHDGRYVYFSSARGGSVQIWKVPAEGGTPERVSLISAFAPEESPDGKFLYFLHDEEIWRLPLRDGAVDGPPQTVVSSLMRGDWGNWTATNEGVYYIQRQKSVWGTIVYQDASGGHPRAIYSLTNPPSIGSGLTVSPDGKTILFVQVDRNDSSIFVQ